MFDENMHGILSALNEKLEEIKRISESPSGQSARLQKEADGCVVALSQLQRTLSDMTRELESKAGPVPEEK